MQYKSIIKGLLLCLTTLFAFAKAGQAQVYMGGPTCVQANEENLYYVTGNFGSGDYIEWCVSNGTTSSGNSCENGYGLNYVMAKFTTSGQITVYTPYGAAFMDVMVVGSLTPGYIASNGSQTIVYNSTPATITCQAPTGGGCYPSYEYQWEQSANGTSWSAMSGQTNGDLSFSSGLTQTTYFRRKVTESSSGSIGYSNTATVFVNPQLTAGSISPGSQNIFSGSSAGTISGGAAGGGSCSGNYSYQWQYSTDNSTFNNISGATGQSYSPGTLSTTTYYRRRVICSTETAYTTSVVVNVYQHLTAGSISPSSYTTTYNTSPGQISASAATGGICGGYSYQWRSFTGNGQWVDISGATGQNYTPGPLTITTYYQRVVTCGSEVLYTNTATVVVPLSSGTVSGGTSPIVQGTSPGVLSMSASLGGDCNNPTYQWQYSTDGTNFYDLSAYGQSYSPGTLSATTHYRCKTTCGSTVYSNVRTIVVNPPLSSGSISPTSSCILASTSPGQLTGTAASGGVCGSYTYEWEWSPNNSNWYSTGVSTQNYTPSSLTSTTYYRRKVSCGSEVQYSNVSLITVYNALTIGTISGGLTPIVAGSSPGQLTVGAASGGACSGSYTYQWQMSFDGTSFYNTSGNGLTYLPSELYSTRHYRVMVTINGYTAYSGVKTITVYQPLNPGEITTESFEVPYNTTPSSINATASSEGNGSYAYQWERSVDDINFVAISGATSQNYSFSGGLTQDYYYRRKTTCGNDVGYTNSIMITITCSPGAVTCSQVIQPGGTVSAFTVTNSGGPGTISYQWESSPDEINWTSISGATSTSFTPTAPASTLYYRVKVSCDDRSVYANTVRIKVKGAVVSNTPNSSMAASNQTAIAMPSYPTGTDANNQNYVRTRTFAKPGIADLTTANAQTALADVAQITEYVDGLGRPMQSIAKGATPAGSDMITTTWYDAFGQVAQKYLPYTDNSSSGNFRIDPNTQQPSFYNSYLNSTEAFYYSNTIFEATPLNRVLQESAPGKSWTGSSRGTRIVQRTNRKEEDVKIWSIGTATGAIPSTASIAYSTGELFVTETTDESEGKVIEYKDKQGRVVLKKVLNGDAYCETHNGWISTYYIYDDFGRLRWVLQPKAVEWLVSNSWNLSSSSTVQNELCFRYEYDARGRMTIKKVPGAEEVWMVYDNKDRLVMTQDANLRAQSTKQWLITEYDNLNRPVRTGLLNDANDRTYHEGQAALATLSYPTTSSGYDVLTETYYDNYTYAGAKSYDASLNSNLDAGTNPYAETPSNANLTKGMVTGTKTKVLGTSNYLLSTVFYDSKGRVVQTRADNVSGGEDISVNQYDFSGKLLSTYTRHQKPSSTTINVLTKMAYDHAGRVLNIKKSVNGSADKLIARYSYDELGQLKKKELGQNTGSSFLETLDYTYNIRGWINSVNKDFATNSGANANNRYFGMELSYDYGFAQNQFSGNIGGMKWRSKGDGEQRAYGFDYDNLNRLTKADFTQNNSGWNTSAGIDFSVSNLTYDVNGNIGSMTQKGWKLTGSSIIDQLTYGYQSNSNKLNLVSDAYNDNASKLGDFKYDPATKTSTDYSYDANGNMVADANKKISSIAYNYLNLPSVITVTGKGTISYIYDAAGNKLKKIVTEGANTTTTTYIGGFIYEKKNSGSDDLQFISMEEGRIRPLRDVNNNITSFANDYFIKDHLGNVRTVLTDEVKVDPYELLTFEDYNITQQNALWENKSGQSINVAGVRTSVNFGSSGTTNAMLVRQSAANGTIGATKLLKVMAGDRIHTKVDYYYATANNTNNNSTTTLNNIVSSLVNSITYSNAPGSLIKGGETAVSSQLNANSIFSGFVNVTPNTNPNNGSALPKAYLCVLFFDEQFKFDQANSKIYPISYSTNGASTIDKTMSNAIQAGKNGYAYVYFTNESDELVYFDNFMLSHERGPLVEETHYYPFGLVMSGISSRALGFGQPENKHKFNGYELQSQEFSDGSGLEWYDYKNRFYDNQIGRFFVQDRLADEYVYYTPYQFAGNEVPNAIDLDGLEPYYANPVDAIYEYGAGIATVVGNAIDRVKGWFSNKTEVSTPTSVPNTSTVSTSEMTTTVGTNFGGYFSALRNAGPGNTVTGYSLLKVDTKTTTKVETKKETTVGKTKMTTKTSLDGNSTEVKSETSTTVRKIPVTVGVVSASNTQTGEKKSKVEVGTGNNNTKLKGSVEVTTKDNKTNTSIGIGVEQKKGNIKQTTSLGLSF